MCEVVSNRAKLLRPAQGVGMPGQFSSNRARMAFSCQRRRFFGKIVTIPKSSSEAGGSVIKQTAQAALHQRCSSSGLPDAPGRPARCAAAMAFAGRKSGSMNSSPPQFSQPPVVGVQGSMRQRTDNALITCRHQSLSIGINLRHAPINLRPIPGGPLPRRPAWQGRPSSHAFAGIAGRKMLPSCFRL